MQNDRILYDQTTDMPTTVGMLCSLIVFLLCFTAILVCGIVAILSHAFAIPLAW